MNGTTVVSDKTDASGQLTATVNTSSDALSEGEHKTVAFLSKDTTHEYAADEDTLTIEKKATSLSIRLDKSSRYVSESVVISGTLKKNTGLGDGTATGYANQSITLRIGSVVKSLTTNASGNYSYTHKATAGGKLQCKHLLRRRHGVQVHHVVDENADGSARPHCDECQGEPAMTPTPRTR